MEGTQPIEEIIRFLEACITPVALISGVGLLLLTITNRLGRTIDRTRTLIGELEKKENEHKREDKKAQIQIMYQRSKTLRLSIAFITLSIICSTLLIPLLVLMIFFEIPLGFPNYFLFIISVLSILVAAIYFFRDVLLSLKALNLEAHEYLP